MKIFLIAIIMASTPVWACQQGTYAGDVELANSLINKNLSCNYNGQKSKGSLVVSRPRCFNPDKTKVLQPTVTLNAFGTAIEISSIQSRTIHGTAKTFAVYSMTSNKTDLPISCEERN